MNTNTTTTCTQEFDESEKKPWLLRKIGVKCFLFDLMYWLIYVQQLTRKLLAKWVKFQQIWQHGFIYMYMEMFEQLND